MKYTLFYLFGILLIRSFKVQGYQAKKLNSSISRYAPIVREFIICPFTSGVKLDCDVDGDIEVNFAFYGREKNTYLCMEDSIGLVPPPNVCYIDGDEEIMYKKCNGKNTCSIFVDPADAGDCADSIPYVFIRHTCTNFVTPSIEASTAAPGSDTANIFDRSLSSHFETQYEAQPWLTLTLNKSMIVTRVTVHFHDDEKFIDPSKVVVQVTNASDTANESSPINTSGSRTCFKDAWLGMTYYCFNNDANDAMVIFSKVPGALGIKEVVISTVPEFVDIA